MTSRQEQLVDFLLKEEGFVPNVYKDSAGKDTVGVGHLVLPGEDFSGGVTKERAKQLLLDDIGKHTRKLDDDIVKHKLELSDSQYTALGSLIFNIGEGGYEGSTVRKKLLEGDIQGAAKAFNMWNKAGGKVSKGLTNRRARESQLFAQAAADKKFELPAQPPTDTDKTFSDVLEGTSTEGPSIVDEFDQLPEQTNINNRMIQDSIITNGASDIILGKDNTKSFVYEEDLNRPLNELFKEPDEAALENILKGFGEGAGFKEVQLESARRESKIFQSIEKRGRGKETLDRLPDFDKNFDVVKAINEHPTLSKIIKTEQFEGVKDTLLRSVNQEDFEAKVEAFTNDLRRQGLQLHGGTAAALSGSVAGALLDPLIAVGSASVKGATALATGLRTGALGSAQALFDEVILQMIDPTRTKNESALNVAGAAVLGGALGASVHAISPNFKISSFLQTEMAKGNVPVVDPKTGSVVDIVTPEGKSIGAAAVDIGDSTIHEGGFFKIPGVGKALKGFYKMSPNVRARAGNKVAAKQADLLTTTEYLTPDSIKSGVKAEPALDMKVQVQSDTLKSKSLMSFNEGYSEHVKYSSEKGLPRLNQVEFETALATDNRKLAQGLITLDEIDDAGVRKTLGDWQKIYKEIEAEHVRLGNLPEDVRANYNRFQLNREKVLMEWEGFVKAAGRGAKARVMAIMRADGIADDIAQKAAEKLEKKAPQILADLEEGLLEGQLKFSKPVRGAAKGLQKKKGTFQTILNEKEYTASLSDIPELNEFWSNDIKHANLEFIQKNIATIEANKAGIRTVDDVLKPIKDDLLMRKDTMTPEKFKAFSEDAAEKIEILTEFYNNIMGVRPKGAGISFSDKAASVTKSYNFITQLGGVATTMLLDAPQVIMNKRLGRILGDELSHLSDAIAKIDTSKIDPRTFGIGAEELFLDEAVQRMDTPLSEVVATGLPKYARKFQGLAFKTFWMAKIDRGFRNIAAKDAAFAVIESLQAYKNKGNRKFSDNVFRYLHDFGITEARAKGLIKQLDAHSTVEKGVVNPHFEKWSGDDFITMKASILRQADKLVTRAGIGDIPFFIQRGWGSVYAQYSNYLFGFQNKILIPFLQNPASKYGAMVLSVMAAKSGMASMFHMLKDKTLNKEPDTIQNYFMRGAATASPLSFLQEIPMKIFGGLFGEYSNLQSGSDMLIGPTGSTLNKWKTVLSKSGKGDFDKQFWRSLRGVTPLANFLPIDIVLRRLEMDEKLGAKFGAPDKRKVKGLSR